ncbi:MAG TPA: carboxypeptidase-like regulatory domain-containing protein [Gemmataceae bacterium]|nr:carboxypeptidase-like regulatory domain-containing protein [Gemmataceae bacterium]
MGRIVILAPGLFLLAWLTGCGGGEGSVSGTVTFDGHPVPNGTVTFVKTEGGLVREGAVITDGTFQVKLPPGKYKIEVNGRKVVGKKKQKNFDGVDEEVEITDELFPDRYNKATELSEEIKPGSNTITLELKSKK